MGRRTIDNRDELDEAAVKAAEVIIARDGRAALTARGLAGVLQISVGTVYNVVPSMGALAEQVNERTVDRLRAVIEKIPTKAREVDVVLDDFADGYIDFVEGNQNLWSCLFDGQWPAVDEQQGDEASFPRTESVFALLEDTLAPLVADPETRAMSARALWATMHGTLAVAFSGRLPILKIKDVRELIRFATRCHVAGLKSGIRV